MNSIEKIVAQLKNTSTEKVEVTRTDNESTKIVRNEAERHEKTVFHVDLESLHNKGIITLDDLRSTKSEEYRRLKRPILQNIFGKSAQLVPNGNLVMVTSSLAGEGKTFTVLNLAMSMALERDTTILLVDCDVVNPTLSRTFGLQEHIGLMDYLVDDKMMVSDIIVNTDIHQLRLIPAGLPHSQSTELLASNRMRSLTEELSKRYSDRVVLFDAPPMLLASQATVLSQLMGQIVLVVEAENTTHDTVRQTVDLLDPDKAIGMVLNKARKISSSGYYGEYYGYGSSDK
jgi:protein-tyrosine kinase